MSQRGRPGTARSSGAPGGRDRLPDPGLAATALVAALLFAGLLAVFPDPDPDIWWHLKTGEVIVRQLAVPRTDIFTFTAAGRPWVTHEWLSEVLFYAVHRIGGADLLVLGKALLAVLALGLGAWAGLTGGRARDRLAPAAAGVLLAAPLLATRAFARPHLLTAVLLGWLLLLLRREGASGRRIWRAALVPLFALWANLHSGFVLGLLLVLLYWAGQAIDRRCGRPPGPAAGAGAASRRPTHGSRRRLRNLEPRPFLFAVLVAATLLNPHHVQALLYPFRLFLRPEVRGHILELRSVFHPDYRGGLFLYALGLTGAALATLLVGAGRRATWAVLLPGLAFGLMGLRVVRGLTEFAALVPALLALNGSWLGRRRTATCGISIGVILLVGAGVALCLRTGIPMGREGSRRPGLGISATMVPDQAAVFLQAIGPQGRLFNPMGFGGYLIHELWPERRVYIDGRLDVFPAEFLREYGRLVRTGEGWERVFDERGITLAVVDYRPGPAADAGLRGRLRASADWSCVFLSHNAAVYARHVPENEAMLARFGCPLDPLRLSVETIREFARTADPEDLERAISSLRAMTEVAPREKLALVVLGQLLDAAGRSREASGPIRQALAAGPESADARLLLAATLLRADSLRAARTELDRLLASGPKRVDAALLLAEIQQGEGDLEGARATLLAAQKEWPGHPAIPPRLEALSRAAGR